MSEGLHPAFDESAVFKVLGPDQQSHHGGTGKWRNRGRYFSRYAGFVIAREAVEDE